MENSCNATLPAKSGNSNCLQFTELEILPSEFNTTTEYRCYSLYYLGLRCKFIDYVGRRNEKSNFISEKLRNL